MTGEPLCQLLLVLVISESYYDTSSIQVVLQKSKLCPKFQFMDHFGSNKRRYTLFFYQNLKQSIKLQAIIFDIKDKFLTSFC